MPPQKTQKIVQNIEEIHVELFIEGRKNVNNGSKDQRKAKKYFNSTQKNTWESQNNIIQRNTNTRLKFSEDKFIADFGIETFKRYLISVPTEEWTVITKGK